MFGNVLLITSNLWQYDSPLPTQLSVTLTLTQSLLGISDAYPPITQHFRNKLSELSRLAIIIV